MKPLRTFSLRSPWAAPGALLLALLLAGTAGCAANQPPSDEDAAAGGSRSASSMAEPEAGPSLAPTDSSVRTVQLYATGDERRLPVLALGTGRSEGLTLEFDLLGEEGRALSVWFYHADREWQRDDVPARYLDGFRSSDVLDYRRARAGGRPYVHYTYRFPEGGVGFRASGNYVLRVTERGREDAVLFERPFYVSESAGALEMSLDELRVGMEPGTADRLEVRYRPPQRLGNSTFDFAACFVPGGDIRRTRCVDRPDRPGPPVMSFRLPYRESFVTGTADFFLDLSTFDPGGEIASVDPSVGQQAARVILETDYAEFAGAGRAPPLDGQVVVRQAGGRALDPAVGAEYARVRFRFVPPERRPLSGPLVVTGSFHAGALASAPRLDWRPAAGRYEGTLLLKQGLYEYRYASPDPRLRRALERSLPPARRRYAAFIYYRDRSLRSDRLLVARAAEVE